MAQIPYSGVQTVAPTEAAIPNVRNDAATEAAFGGNVGAAIQGLGKVISGAGDEIFQRAMALQQMNNAADADNAATDYLLNASKVENDYLNLRGKDPAGAFDGYQQSLEKLRITSGQDLNPAARKLYDSSTRRTLTQTIFGGMRHAATENKKYLFDSSGAKMDVITDKALSAPMDDKAFAQSQIDIIDEVDNQGGILGWDKTQIDNQVSLRTSKLWASRIEGISKTQPLAAQAMLETNRDKIRGQDYAPLEQKVQSKIRDVGARSISTSVNDGFAPYTPAVMANRTQGVEESLVTVFKKAQQDNPDLRMGIGGQGGTRNPAEQAEIVRRGASRTMDSNHIPRGGAGGRALDIVPLDAKGNEIAKPDEATVKKHRVAIERAAKELGVELSPQLGWDPSHTELPRSYDTRTFKKPAEETMEQARDRGVAYIKTVTQDPVAIEAVEKNIIGDYNQRKAVKMDGEWRAKVSIDGAIVGNFSDKLPTTVDELKASNPEVAKAWDSLNASKQKPYYAQLAKNANADKVTWNAENQKRYAELKGMSGDAPADFMAQNILDENMPWSAKKEMINLQVKLKADPNTNAWVGQAMQTLMPTLESAGITKNQSELRVFRGRLQDALTVWSEENKGKKPGPEDARVIGTQLLQLQAGTGYWYSPDWGREATYKVTPPAKDVERIKAKPEWKQLNIEPDDDMIQRVYAQELYTKLYGKTKAAAPTILRPSVPTSQ